VDPLDPSNPTHPAYQYLHDASAGGDCGWAPVIVAGVALALLLYVCWRVCR
jgi:hypothetical protein